MKHGVELWSLVCAAFAIGWIAAPVAQGTAQAPPWQGRPGKANWLTDGGDPQRTAWQRNETLITKESVKDMKLAVEAAARQPAAPDAQPLSAAHRQRRDDRRRAEGDRGRRRRLRQHLRHRRRHGHAALEAASSTARSSSRPAARAGVLCPGGLTATPVIAPTDAAGQVHRLRDLVGRPAAHARRRDRRGRRAARAVPAAQRQAVRAEPPRQRDLHDDRAGLRRQSQRVLRLRPRDEESRQYNRAAAACGRAPAVDRQGRHGLRRVAATATTTPSGRSTARRSSA